MSHHHDIDPKCVICDAVVSAHRTEEEHPDACVGRIAEGEVLVVISFLAVVAKHGEAPHICPRHGHELDQMATKLERRMYPPVDATAH